MNPILRAMMARYMKPAGDDGSDTGGTDVGLADRGDDFVATDDDAPETPAKTPKATKADAPALKNPFEDGEEGEDAEGEGEGEDEGEDAEAEAAKAKAKNARIPLNRHKEILAKERQQREALEQRLAQYERGQQVAQTNEELTSLEDGILTMERQYNSFLADGEIEKATALMSKIRQTERQIVETKAEMRSQAAEVRARESARYDIALERIEESYPELNPDDDAYDKELVVDVIDLKAVYQGRGMPPTKALQAAVKKLLGQDTRAQKNATDVAPRVTDQDIAAERKKGAVQKAADAARRTPPSSRDVGLDSDKAGKLSPRDIMSMKQEDFNKLDETALAKLRGDIA